MTRIDDITSSGSIPLELQRSVPREVMLTAAGRTLVGLTVLMLIGALAGGVWLYTLAAEAAAAAELRRREGVPVVAEITSIRRTRGDKPRAIMEYRFTAEGREHTGRGSMPARRARGLEAGSAIAVHYLRSAPQTNWLTGYAAGGPPFAVVPLLPLALLGGAVLILISIHRQRRLLEEGRPALARVTAHRRVAKGQHGSRRVDIEFEELSGAHRATYFDVTGKAPEPGSSVVVVYDRENPKRAVRYPLSLVRVVTPL